MYYFTALAIGAEGAEFWPVTLGSSIQILATVLDLVASWFYMRPMVRLLASSSRVRARPALLGITLPEEPTSQERV